MLYIYEWNRTLNNEVIQVNESLLEGMFAYAEHVKIFVINLI